MHEPALCSLVWDVKQPDPQRVRHWTRRARELLQQHPAEVVLGLMLAELEAIAAEPVPDPDQLLNWREAGIPRTTFRRACRSNDLPHVILGREYRAKRADVQRYLASKVKRPALALVDAARKLAEAVRAQRSAQR